jgi:hypothetical protein
MNKVVDSYAISDGNEPESTVYLYAALLEDENGRLSVEIDAFSADVGRQNLNELISVLGIWESRIAVRDASFPSSGQYSLDV